MEWTDNSGWIRLHRKVLSNDAMFRSGNTFPLFCMLLLLADRNGTITVGRHQLSQWLKMKPSTVYLGLKRLENMNSIQLKPNNKMTVVHICNWSKYQSKPDNKITTKQQQNNTITRIKNKEYKDIDLSSIENPKLKKACEEFILHRITLKAKLTPLAFTKFQNRLEKLFPNNIPRQIEAIDECIERNWKTVFISNQEPTTPKKETKLQAEKRRRMEAQQ